MVLGDVLKRFRQIRLAAVDHPEIVADMIPNLDDKELATLRDNARRLEASGDGRQQQQAAEAMPLIEAELAARLALKPPKKVAKPRATKAKVAKATSEAA